MHIKEKNKEVQKKREELLEKYKDNSDAIRLIIVDAEDETETMKDMEELEGILELFHF